jgi:hypothetical protein
MTQSIDGMQKQRTSAYIQPPRAQSTIPKRTFSNPIRPATKPRRRVPQWLQIVLAVPLIMLVSLFIQSAIFGQLVIVGYGIAACIWQIPSRTTFSLALCALIATTVLLVVRGELVLAQSFATYTFLLLVVGVITLSRELKKEGGRIYSSRQNKHY